MLPNDMMLLLLVVVVVYFDTYGWLTAASYS